MRCDTQTTTSTPASQPNICIERGGHAARARVGLAVSPARHLERGGGPDVKWARPARVRPGRTRSPPAAAGRTALRACAGYSALTGWPPLFFRSLCSGCFWGHATCRARAGMHACVLELACARARYHPCPARALARPDSPVTQAHRHTYTRSEKAFLDILAEKASGRLRPSSFAVPTFP